MVKDATELNREMLEFIAGTPGHTHVNQYREALEKAMDYFDVIGFEKQVQQNKRDAESFDQEYNSIRKHKLEDNRCYEMEQIDNVVFDATCINIGRKTHFDSDGDPYYQIVVSVVHDDGNTVLSVYSDKYIKLRESGDIK